MAQPRPKQPLDVLQSMINGILIEVGRALRASDKEGGRTLTNANTRLRSFFPSANDNFHQALDDLEGDIVRAKAVFTRDLQELRSQRLALENSPTQAAEGTKIQDSEMVEDQQDNIKKENNELTPQPTIKEENLAPQVPELRSTEDRKPIETNEMSKETVPKISDSSKELQGLSPLSSNDGKADLVGLGIDTSAATDDATPATAGRPDSSVNSLFDMPGSGNPDGSELNFDNIEFLDSNNTQGQNEFDLSTFGNSQDFNIPDLHNTNDSGNTDNSDNKQDKLYDIGNPSGGGDLMDLDLDLGVVGGDDGYDDMFFGTGDDGNTGDRGEMQHGEYDSVFFGLD